MSKAEPSGGNASQVQMEPAENQVVVYQPNETVRARDEIERTILQASYGKEF